MIFGNLMYAVSRHMPDGFIIGLGGGGGVVIQVS